MTGLDMMHPTETVACSQSQGPVSSQSWRPQRPGWPLEVVDSAYDQAR